jgi:ABC-2 type transport system permease protein
MNKIWLVTQREFLTRVKNKTFILTTILAPIGLLVFFIAVGFVMNQGSDKAKVIKVVDTAQLLDEKLETTRDNLTFEFQKEPIDAIKSQYVDKDNDKKRFHGILELVPIKDSLMAKYDVVWHSDDQLALDESYAISAAIEKKIRDFKLRKLKIDEKSLTNLETKVTIEPKGILDNKEVSSITSMVGAGLGAVVSYIMFFIILLYGSQVMRSVMEEKINRIVEVLISSIKPFELMMGKVLGVGLVGLTQVAIWMVLMPIIYLVGSKILGVDTSQLGNARNLPPEMMESATGQIGLVLHELKSMNWMLIVPLTLFYFLAGYFAYASLFAAVGSAVGEDINEAQSLTMPLMLPLMFGFYISISAMKAPDSSLVVWASMIPLLSSVVMPVRLPFDPPAWQIIVSVVSLLLFMVFLVWLAGRIYRIGILMYGKKASFKELAKWVFYKG